MKEEDIEELKEFTIDINDIDELALGLEVCSKKSNMVIQEFTNLIIELQQENKQLKEKIKSAEEFCDRYMSVNLELFDMYELLNKIREILGGKENE